MSLYTGFSSVLSVLRQTLQDSISSITALMTSTLEVGTQSMHYNCLEKLFAVGIFFRVSMESSSIH